MKFGGITFRWLVALALDGQGMYQDRAPNVLGVGESLNETIQPVSFDGADVLKLQGLKEHAGGEKTHERVLTSSCHLQNVVTNPGDTAENTRHILLDADGQLTGHLAAQKR